MKGKGEEKAFNWRKNVVVCCLTDNLKGKNDIKGKFEKESSCFFISSLCCFFFLRNFKFFCASLFSEHRERFKFLNNREKSRPSLKNLNTSFEMAERIFSLSTEG